jgi:phage terminase large subunit-like protein
MSQAVDWSFLDKLSPNQAAQMLSSIEGMSAKVEMQKSLVAFIKGAWAELEPGRELLWNWHMDVLCGYLEALDAGVIRRLIVNIPPGTMKSLIVNVFYPSWVWCRKPNHKFLTGSNDGILAVRDAMKMRTLIEGEWFQEKWGDIVKKNPAQWEKELFSNTVLGHRQSQGVLARVTGKRADTLIWDDPHDAKQTESEVQRRSVIEAWEQGWASRLNDPNKSAVVLIMQRLHEDDATGFFLKNGGWTHLVIPMRYDPDNTYDPNEIGRPDLKDPRKEGELLFPQRFNDQSVAELERYLGPYGAAGQLQQRPAPKGGGELKKSWLKFYTQKPKNGNRYIIVDPGGEKKQGHRGKKDNTAIGVFEYCEDNNYYLIDGIRDKLGLTERTELLFRWHRKYKPKGVYYEKYGKDSDIVHIQYVMEDEGYRFKIEELSGKLAKEDRVRRLIPILADGRFWLPLQLFKTIDGKPVDIIDQFVEVEYLPFPVGKYDDFLDMCSRIVDIDMKAPGVSKTHVRVQRHRIKDRGIGY